MDSNPLVELQKLGQSIWYDNIRRALLDTGDLARKIGAAPLKGVTSNLQQKIGGDDLRGVTSNPTIFEKAITGSTDYDETIRQLVGKCRDTNEIYEALVIEDIQRTADLFFPVYARTAGVDGYVSLEVSPLLARDTESTINEALRLHGQLGRKNVMIKVPATAEGIPAVEALIAEGVNVNVTLIFSRQIYEQVAEAYIRGLEKRAAAGKPVDEVASVASFFVSRIDTNVDAQLEFRIRRAEDPTEKALLEALLGKVAIANAKLAYQRFKEIFGNARFRALAAKGARAQRPLWASTGTKNPKYSDVYYVEELIGPDTVNTVPPATFTAFRDHGKPRLSLEENIDNARRTLTALADAGIALDQVTSQLQDEGVKSFSDSFNSLMASIDAKRSELLAGLADRTVASLGGYSKQVEEKLKEVEAGGYIRRIWQKDASLWKSEPEHQKIIRNALGWLTVVEQLQEAADELVASADRARQSGITDVMLLGMGGSSLCPEVFRRTFGKREGYPELHVLDSTDAATVRAFEAKVNVENTLFIVSSKSGTTTEPIVFYEYFFDRVRQKKDDRAGEHFVAITDPGTLMEQIAREKKFRRVFLNPADIGGRYSALSFFGMVPAAMMGLDIRTLLDRASRMVAACERCVAVSQNPGARLGTILGTMALAGRDKLTLSTSPDISSLGLWIEQLIAESTGKEGKGIIPIAGEHLGVPSDYGNDRLFVHISVGPIDSFTDAKLFALESAGHPVVRRILHDALDLGEEFFLWEMSTALAGAILGINSFDQPNVQESKDFTKSILEEYKKAGKLPEQSAAAEGSGCRIYGDEQTVEFLKSAEGGGTLGGQIAAHLGRVKAGDYIALLDYIQETPRHDELLHEIRTHLRDSLRAATTTGYGPRFLHSTGQLHKGGPDSGVFIQITADTLDDVPIPGEPFTFGVLKQAQALGDFSSLAKRNRRALRFHVGANIEAGLKTLLEIVRERFPIGQSTTG